MLNSQIRSLLFAVSRRLSRSSLEHTRGILCVGGRFYQNQFFSELLTHGWVSSFSLTSRRGQRTDTNDLLPGAVFRPYHITYFRFGSDTRILFLFSFALSRDTECELFTRRQARYGGSTSGFVRVFISEALAYMYRMNSLQENAIKAEKDHVDFLNLLL